MSSMWFWLIVTSTPPASLLGWSILTAAPGWRLNPHPLSASVPTTANTMAETMR